MNDFERDTLKFMDVQLDELRRLSSSIEENRLISLSRKQILDVLERHSSMCLDNDEERQLVADALMRASDESADNDDPLETLERIGKNKKG